MKKLLKSLKSFIEKNLLLKAPILFSTLFKTSFCTFNFLNILERFVYLDKLSSKILLESSLELHCIIHTLV